MKYINSSKVYNRNTHYSQAVAIDMPRKLVFISGQIPVKTDGSVPENFEDQAKLVWGNIKAQLEEAGLSLKNIIKHTTYLSDRRYHTQNSAIRQAVLSPYEPALTVLICGIFDEGWLLEIEAVAAA